MKNNENIKYIIPALLIFIAIAIMFIFLYISSTRTLNSLENILFQVFIFGLGVQGSYIIGKQSAKKAALEIIKPHAKASFRRVHALFLSLSRLLYAIENAREVEGQQNNAALDMLEAIVIEQVATADDALEDWKDIVPDEVEDVLKRFNNRNNHESD